MLLCIHHSVNELTVDRLFPTYFAVDYLCLLRRRWDVYRRRYVNATVRVIYISRRAPLYSMNSSNSTRHQRAKQLLSTTSNAIFAWQFNTEDNSTGRCGVMRHQQLTSIASGNLSNNLLLSLWLMRLSYCSSVVVVFAVVRRPPTTRRWLNCPVYNRFTSPLMYTLIEPNEKEDRFRLLLVGFS